MASRIGRLSKRPHKRRRLGRYGRPRPYSVVTRLPGTVIDDDCPICKAMGIDLSAVPEGESVAVPVETDEELRRLEAAFVAASALGPHARR